MLAKRLEKGNTIGIITPSKQILDRHKEYINNFNKYLNGLGFKVIFGKNAFNIDKYGLSGGTPQQRVQDINEMFANKNINAIWCVHGGETVNQLLNLIDYDIIKNNPKIFLGNSDIDVLLMTILKKTGLITFHAPDTKIGGGINMDFNYSQDHFNKRLISGDIGKIEKITKWKTIRSGKAKGTIIGCNLSSIIKLIGTPHLPTFKNSILFLESYAGKVRDVIYKLTQLKNIGLLSELNGIVIGYIYGHQDKEIFKKDPKTFPDGSKAKYEDIVLEICQEYNFPILKINEFGHRCPNTFLPIGGECEIDADKLEIKIIEKYID